MSRLTRCREIYLAILERHECRGAEELRKVSIDLWAGRVFNPQFIKNSESVRLKTRPTIDCVQAKHVRHGVESGAE